MKKSVFLLASIVMLCALTGCQTTQNHGVISMYPDNTNLATVTFDRFVVVESIDGENVAWGNSWNTADAVQLDAGVHTFGLKYHDKDGMYTKEPQAVIVLLETGKSYKVSPVINFLWVNYSVVETETQKSVLLDLDTLYGEAEDENYMSNFIDAILNPTMEGVDQTVVEEGDDFILYNEPDMKFTLVDKATGEIKTGHRGFVTDFTFTSGTVYLKFDDGTVTSDEFLESNYQEDADIIMIVTDCDKKTVTYTYIKPDDLKGKIITLNISQKD